MSDVVIVVTDVEAPVEDEHELIPVSSAYAVTKVFRFDVEGDVQDFIKYVMEYNKVVHGEKLEAVPGS